MFKQCDILNLEWSSYPSRDRVTASLICNYIKYQGYTVKERSIHNGIFYIKKYRPKVIFLTNMIGGQVNLRIAKYCKKNNIPLISGISEGNFQDHGKEIISQFVWGWNTSHILFDQLTLYWTERTRNYAYKYFPKLKDHLVVAGAVGFDKYKIEENKTFHNRNIFLSKYNKQGFSRVIGIGCWDFGHVFTEDPRFKEGRFSKMSIERFKKDRELFRSILSETINNNAEILFILKEHPGVLLGKMASGIDGIDKYSNVVIIKNEESIFDCISISDFWIVYESTTALEAWLMNKQTCLINPSGIDFPREKYIHLGSPNYSNHDSLNNAIFNFYKNAELPGFSNLSEFRNDAIKRVIQWDDGLNHVRAGNEILKFLKNASSDTSIPFNVKDFIYSVKWLLKQLIKTIIYQIKPSNDFFINRQVDEYSNQMFHKQVQFYLRNDYSKKYLLELLGI